MNFFSRFFRPARATAPVPGPPDWDTSLGAILLRMQALAPAQLAAALADRASKEDHLLGEWLSEHRVCSVDVIKTALSVQHKFRSGDTSGALLELLESRLKMLAEGERRISDAIDNAIDECEREGQAPNHWLSPPMMHAAE